VYAAQQFTAGVVELVLVPSYGSLAPARLSGTLVAGGNVQHFRLTPDGKRAVYTADQDTDEVLELYSVPLDRSAGAVKLAGPLVVHGDVHSSAEAFAISPDGARVVYVADQETDQVFELFSAPVDGRSPAVKLNGPLVAGGDVLGASGTPLFAIAPDAKRVVYVADERTDGRLELFSAPLDGSSGALRLSGGMLVGGGTFRIDATSSRVVYRARATLQAPFELFSAPLDGSQPPARLNDDLAGGEVQAFRLSPNGRWVAYTADHADDDVYQLFAVPIEGGAPPEKLNGPLVAGGSVVWNRYDGLQSLFEFHPDSTRVYYVADQDVDEVRELYLSYVGRPRSESQAPPPGIR